MTVEASIIRWDGDEAVLERTLASARPVLLMVAARGGDRATREALGRLAIAAARAGISVAGGDLRLEADDGPAAIHVGLVGGEAASVVGAASIEPIAPRARANDEPSGIYGRGPEDLAEGFLASIAAPGARSRRRAWRGFDRLVGGGTLRGGDRPVAVVRSGAASGLDVVAVAMRVGARARADAHRHLAAAGARATLDATSDDGTVAIALAEVADLRSLVDPVLPGPGRVLALLGPTTAEPHDEASEVALEDLLVAAIGAGHVEAARAVDPSGIAGALAAMTLGGGCGCAIALGGDLPIHVALTSPWGARAVVACRPDRAAPLADLSASRGVPFLRLGETGGPRVVVDGAFDLSLETCRGSWDPAVDDGEGGEA